MVHVSAPPNSPIISAMHTSILPQDFSTLYLPNSIFDNNKRHSKILKKKQKKNIAKVVMKKKMICSLCGKQHSKTKCLKKVLKKLIPLSLQTALSDLSVLSLHSPMK